MKFEYDCDGCAETFIRKTKEGLLLTVQSHYLIDHCLEGEGSMAEVKSLDVMGAVKQI